MAARLLVGVGNRLRGDDGVGLEVAHRVAAMDLVDVVVAEPLDLVDLLAGHEHVVVVDAAAPAGRPGRVRRLDVDTEAIEDRRDASTHGIGVGQALELARAFGVLPGRLVVVTVEALQVGVGAGLSEPVEAALDEAVAVALDALDVRDLGPQSGRPRPLPRTTRA